MKTRGFWRGTREAIEAVGDDAASFLQGQLSQDVLALSPGESAWSLLLAPQGKIDALLRVTRIEENRFVLDVEAGYTDAVITRLARFRLRTKCELNVLPWTSVSVRGASSQEVEIGHAEIVANVEWNGSAGFDALGADLVVPEGLDELSADEYEALRIQAGEPAMGRELNENTIPAAAGIVDRTVSFTKGCYTGQELVARIDSRGNNVPRRLLGLRSGPDSALSPGDDVVFGGKVVGHVTSSAPGAGVALAYIGRAVEDGASVEVADSSHELVSLPFGTVEG